MSLETKTKEPFDPLTELTQIIKTKYDHDFSEYASSSFKRRIERFLLIKKIETIPSLINLISKNEINFKKFLGEISVNVTEMFRDPYLWKSLREETLPLLLESNSNLKILHTGCSSGEEVYSLKIILDELGVKPSCHIDAFDLDKSIINKAKQGFFNKKDLKTNADNFKETGSNNSLLNFLTKSDEYYLINNNLKEDVLFFEGNLATDDLKGQYDLIFCRNLLIYFNQSLQNKVLKKISKALNPKGILIIGSKESISWCESFSDFHCINRKQKIFQKKEMNGYIN